MTTNDDAIAARIVAAATKHARRPAVEIEKRVHSYAQLLEAAQSVAEGIAAGDGEEPAIGLYCARGFGAYASVLGALLAGKAYVPLNPTFPVARTRSMIQRSGVRTLVASPDLGAAADELLASVHGGSVLSFSPEPLRIERRRSFPQGAIGDHAVAASGAPAASSRNGPLSYVLFTSGSTGQPKGVPVREANLRNYLDAISEQLAIGADDRVSQTFDLTFDLSVHDMLVCWSHGACLCYVPDHLRLSPAPFVRDRALTCWFSVPSTISIARRLGELRPDCMSSLRHSLFCGEALVVDDARAWQRAAPSSSVINLYGPTETTIAVTAFRFDERRGTDGATGGTVPIGHALRGNRIHILDEHLRPVPAGTVGEICIGGAQVTDGYLAAEAQTRERYVRVAEDDGPVYRTGDLGLERNDGCVAFLGRSDDQIKINGYRVELEDIEQALRAASESPLAVAVPFRDETLGTTRVYGFVLAPGGDEPAIRSRCAELVPRYMVPERVFCVAEVPRSAAGKVDRSALKGRIPELTRRR